MELNVVVIECNKQSSFYDEPSINLFERSYDAFTFAKEKIEALKKNGFEELPWSQEEDECWYLKNDKTNVEVNVYVLTRPVYEKYYSVKSGHKLI